MIEERQVTEKIIDIFYQLQNRHHAQSLFCTITTIINKPKTCCFLDLNVLHSSSV